MIDYSSFSSSSALQVGCRRGVLSMEKIGKAAVYQHFLQNFVVHSCYILLKFTNSTKPMSWRVRPHEIGKLMNELESYNDKELLDWTKSATELIIHTDNGAALMRQIFIAGLTQYCEKIPENTFNELMQCPKTNAKTESILETERKCQEDVQADALSTDKCNLVINYIPQTMSEGTLATLFSPYGVLERCKIVVDLETRPWRSRGFGFVKYEKQISAQMAMKALNGYELNGKRLKVSYAQPQCKAIRNANLYITNVPTYYKNDDLNKLFKNYGKVISCRILMNKNGQSRGKAFVRMDTHHNAIRALQLMDQCIVDDKLPPIAVKLAERFKPQKKRNYS
eukprot:225713_1